MHPTAQNVGIMVSTSAKILLICVKPVKTLVSQRDSVKNVIMPFRIICLTMLNKFIKVVFMKLSKGLDKGNPLNLEGNYLLTNKEGVNHEHRKFTRIQL